MDNIDKISRELRKKRKLESCVVTDPDNPYCRYLGMCDICNEYAEREHIVIEDEDKMPKEYALSQNYPNPFNPVTTIKYQLPKDVKVSLTIYNLNGQLVETLISEHQEAGYYTVQWDASNVGSGVYFYRINAGDPSSGSGRVFTDVKKCIVIK